MNELLQQLKENCRTYGTNLTAGRRTFHVQSLETRQRCGTNTPRGHKKEHKGNQGNPQNDSTKLSTIGTKRPKRQLDNKKCKS